MAPELMSDDGEDTIYRRNQNKEEQRFGKSTDGRKAVYGQTSAGSGGLVEAHDEELALRQEPERNLRGKWAHSYCLAHEEYHGEAFGGQRQQSAHRLGTLLPASASAQHRQEGPDLT
eukprot:CAMPEP_0185586678 /NCGR_PEP_ID=MMETSP0434-20130131/45530_1 /TAXON_ID=626734 ORGANISM="Favella taraikaensis, Strain Fe Narragansett Bay" /NCGR_SAMPLE_ID=MMETSP0434 /ASSEMBLY_ACC=CAM_ASM_000379 /LENGTH=116 /DNA_ID=CAMNT_0028207987 /DNA_START=2835 /DNA_END=3184 /DNA_ORIENTATION=-